MGPSGLRPGSPELQRLLAALARALGLDARALAARVTPGSAPSSFPQREGLPGALLRLSPASPQKGSATALTTALARLAGSERMQAKLRHAALLSLDESQLLDASPATLLVGGRAHSLWRPSFALTVDGAMSVGLAGANSGPLVAKLAAWAAGLGGVPAAALDVLASTPKASPATYVLRLSFDVVGEAARETLCRRLAANFQDTDGVRRRARTLLQTVPPIAILGPIIVISQKPKFVDGTLGSVAVAQDGETVVVGTVDFSGQGGGVYVGVSPFGAGNFVKVWKAGSEAV